MIFFLNIFERAYFLDDISDRFISVLNNHNISSYKIFIYKDVFLFMDNLFGVYIILGDEDYKCLKKFGEYESLLCKLNSIDNRVNVIILSNSDNIYYTENIITLKMS